MFLRFQTIILALLTALLIIIGGFGVFIAEASSLPGIIIEAQSYDPGTPMDATNIAPNSGTWLSAPGLPF